MRNGKKMNTTSFNLHTLKATIDEDPILAPVAQKLENYVSELPQRLGQAGLGLLELQLTTLALARLRQLSSLTGLAFFANKTLTGFAGLGLISGVWLSANRARFRAVQLPELKKPADFGGAAAASAVAIAILQPYVSCFAVGTIAGYALAQGIERWHHFTENDEFSGEKEVALS